MNAKLQLPDNQIDATEAGAELRANCLASKLHLKWLGVTRSLSPEQMANLVDGSEVDSKMIRASKRLLDSAHPTMKLLANIRNRMLGTWRGLTLPFVEAGVRLIPRQLVGEFEARMSMLKDELASAVDELEQEWPRLKEAAAARLGAFYNPDDYPDNLEELFVVSWSYPETSVPSYLMAIDASVYRREAARVAEKFEQAVELAEQGLTRMGDRKFFVIRHWNPCVSSSGGSVRCVLGARPSSSLSSLWPRRNGSFLVSLPRACAIPAVFVRMLPRTCLGLAPNWRACWCRALGGRSSAREGSRNDPVHQSSRRNPRHLYRCLSLAGAGKGLGATRFKC